MNRKLKFVILFLTLFFSFNISVKAITCSDINKEISNYNSVNNSLKKLDCNKDDDLKTVNKCNKLNLKKNSYITSLYRLQQTNPSCRVASSKIDTILKDNKDSCSKVSDGTIEKLANSYLIIFYIAGPILLILFASLDYTKAIVSSDISVMRKTHIRFAKRLASLILLYIMPVIVNIILSINNSSYFLSGDNYSCKLDNVLFKNKYTITYVPKEKSSGKRGTVSAATKSGLIKGDYEGYLIRTTKPTMSSSDTKYFNPSESNTGQCVWYVRNRAKEILSTVKIDASYRKKALAAISNTRGNGKEWWKNSGLKMFGSSSNVQKPKVGSIIVFGSCPGHPYGHVAMVEKVNYNSNGKVESINYSEGWANGGSSCPNSRMSCVAFKYRTNVKLANVKVNNSGEPFLGYVYLLD